MAPSTRRLLLAAVALAGQGDGARLRSRQGSAVAELLEEMHRRAISSSTSGNDTVTLEVLENKSLSAKEQKQCLCDLGEFWHWRLKECIKQGGWGYECGFFPEEHHHRVCKDGLACKPVGKKDPYISHGVYEGTAKSFPATCVDCAPEDKCQVGEERHNAECLKEYVLSGEACVTVRVVLPPVTARATATRSHTKEANASANATAQAPAHGVSAKAEAAAKATKCMSAEEAIKMTGHKEGSRHSAVTATDVVSAADEKVFELAAAEAKKLAAEKGFLDAQAAAEELAKAQVAEEAKLKAEASAREADAWKSEANAENKTQEAAEEKAKKAEVEAAAKAQAEAEAAATETAKADAAAEAKPSTDTTTAASTTQAPPPPKVPVSPPVTEPLVPPQKPVEDKNKFRKISNEEFEATRP